MRSKGLNPYAYRWDRTHSAHQLQEIYKNLENGVETNGENDHVSVSGRIVGRRAFGKLAFLTLRDDSGTIQVVSFFLLFFLYNCYCRELPTGLLKYTISALLRKGEAHR